MIRTGLDLWIGDPAPERTMRLGLVSHPAAVLPDLSGSVDALREAGYRLTALFGPEHGFDGGVLDGAQIGDVVDARTGLPVYSLYGETSEPSEQALSQVDAFIFDMQDVGVRFYTYLSTLYYVLRAAGKAGKHVFLLDRPNPITGTIVEGGALEPEFESFVGIVNIPMRHGMTLGELAQFMNAECVLGANLRVVTMQGWRREMWFDETGLPWVTTSPAIPHLSTAVLYPGMCLLEGTNLSLGRGTALPFEVCGAPWLDGHALAEEMNALHLAGVRFRPTSFLPSSSNHAGTQCKGVQVHVTDRNALRPVEMTLYLLGRARRMSGECFSWNAHLERLAGSERLRSSLEAGMPVSEILAGWSEFQNTFASLRAKYLLYS